MHQGLQYDPDEAVQFLATADPRMATVIQLAGPFTMRPRRPIAPFPSLMRAIVYQQLHGKAAATILQRILDLFPGRAHPTPRDILSIKAEALRAAGLSRNKLLAIRDLAAKVEDGSVPSLARLRKMDNEAVIEALLPVRGIGRWTVEMLLIFTLGRADVLPVGDLGVRKGFHRVYGGQEKTVEKRLIRQGHLWQPYRSVATWYLYRATELPGDRRFD